MKYTHGKCFRAIWGHTGTFWSQRAIFGHEGPFLVLFWAIVGPPCPRSLKSVLVLPPQIFGLFGPPKKRVNFDKFNQRQKCVFCVLTALYVSKKTILVYSQRTVVSVFNEMFNFFVSHLFVKYFFVLPVVCFLSTLVPSAY